MEVFFLSNTYSLFVLTDFSEVFFSFQCAQLATNAKTLEVQIENS